jgi:hypothetical protein
VQALSEPPRLRLAASYLFCATQSVEVDWVLHLIGWEAIERDFVIGRARPSPVQFDYDAAPLLLKTIASRVAVSRNAI